MPTTASDPTDPAPRHSHRRHRGRGRSAIWRFIRAWWVELLVGFLLFLAVFLLVERISIRERLADGLRRIVDGASGLLSGAAAGLLGWARSTTLSDLVAYGLVLAVVGLLLWRERQRLTDNAQRTQTACPKCGGELHRIHRRWTDRIVALYVPVRRYQCKNHDCAWHGLRVHRSRYH